MQYRKILVFFGIVLVAFSFPLTAQTHSEVLVVYNSTSPASLEIANHYRTVRNIPAANLCAITPPTNDFLSLNDYNTYVKSPVQACLNTLGQKNILYIVMSYLTPFSVSAGPMRTAAVDSYLADIWDKYVSQPFPIVPSGTHTYYADSQSQGDAYLPFQSFAAYRANPRSILIYSVWRLDGPTAAIATALVDQAIYAETHGLSGQACIDRNRGDLTSQVDASYITGDFDLHQAAVFLRQALGPTLVTEDADAAEFGAGQPNCPNTAIYSGWYSLYNYNNAFTWQPGAIGWHLDSASALNTRSGLSWVPNALAAQPLGVTVTSGSVAEPYLEGIVRPGGVIRNLLEGANVGDAFLRNTRWLKWEILNVGDPLYTPYPGGRPPFSPLQPVNSLQLSPQREIMGGTNATGTITLSSAAPVGGMTFSLTAGPGITVPPTVSLAQGATKANFTINTTAVAQLQVNLITATSGSTSLRNTLITDPVLGFFVAAVNSTMAGIPVTVTAILSGRAPIGGATIMLASDNAAVTVPQSVTVPAGATSATFVANTTPVSSTVVANITGTYAGARTGMICFASSCGLAVYPAINSFQALTTTINAGGTTEIDIALGTFVPPGNTAIVSLTSSDPAALPVPPTLSIPAGAYFGALRLTSSPSSSGRTVTITAQYGGATAQTVVTIN